MAESIRVDLLANDRMSPALRSAGDASLKAAAGAKLLADGLAKQRKAADVSVGATLTLAKADKILAEAEDELAGRALIADKALRREGDAAKDAAREARGARGGILGLTGAVTGFGDAAGVADRKGSVFGRALAGINLATGVLEPALAGLAVTAGATAAAFASAAAGIGAFGLVAGQVMSKASDAANKAATAQAAYQGALAAANAKYQQQMDAATSKAQRQAAVTARQNALQSALAAKVRATTVAYQGLSPAQISLANAIQRAKDQWDGFVKSATPGVAAVMKKAFGVLPEVFKLLRPFLGPTETALSLIINDLRQGLESPFWRKFTTELSGYTSPMLQALAKSVGNVAHGLAGLIEAFLPLSLRLGTSVEGLTAKFAKWGETITSHTGFQSLMTMFRQETPLAVQILKNLGAVLVNVGKSMTGLSTFANSKSLLQALLPVSQLLANLSKNQALDRLVLYLYAAHSAASRLRPAILGVRSAVAFFPAAAAAVTAFAGAAEGATVAQTIAAAATRAWGIAMDALPWVALAAAVVAVAVLIIKYHRQIWAFMQRVWHDILGVIMGAWHWVQKNWPELLGVIVTPFARAAAAIVKNFGQIRHAVADAWEHIQLWTLQAVDAILRAFAHIPFIGKYFKKAHEEVHGWIQAIQGDINRLEGKTISVKVKLSPLGTGPFAGKQLQAGGLIPGYGGGDRVPAMLEAGETVVPKELTPEIAPWAKMRGIPGFAAGGLVLSERSAVQPPLARFERLLDKMFFAGAGRMAQKYATSFPGGPYSGALGGGAAANEALARRMFPWPASQWPPFFNLEMAEAGFNRFARNPSSGAYGIPQALPESKLPFAGQAAGGSHAGPQLSWMFGYIGGRYGNPAGAWAHEQAYHWYGRGGLVRGYAGGGLVAPGARTWSAGAIPATERARVSLPGSSLARMQAAAHAALAALQDNEVADYLGLRRAFLPGPPGATAALRAAQGSEAWHAAALERLPWKGHVARERIRTFTGHQDAIAAAWQAYRKKQTGENWSRYSGGVAELAGLLGGGAYTSALRGEHPGWYDAATASLKGLYAVIHPHVPDTPATRWRREHSRFWRADLEHLARLQERETAAFRAVAGGVTFAGLAGLGRAAGAEIGALRGMGALSHRPGGHPGWVAGLSWWLRGLRRAAGVSRAALGEEYRVYDSGGWLPPGVSVAVNKTGRPEMVMPASRGAAPTVVVNLDVRVAPGAHPAEVGRQVASALNEYFRRGGRIANGRGAVWP